MRNFEDYCQKLAAAYVRLDGAERQQAIATEAARLARDEDLRLRQDPALLAELAGLVEWPVALLGRIDQRFMALPEEVLVTAMRHHQKYLALEDADGRLAPRFVAVANLPTKDDGRAVIAGNERVLRAPVGRAVLLGQGPEAAAREPVPELDGVVFHARLGSLGAKAARLEKLAGWIAQRVPEAKPERDTGRAWPRPIWSPAWSASSRNSRASWAGITRCMTANRPRLRPRSPSTTPRRARATCARAPCQRRRGARR